jgi:hypothetical protein
MHDDEVRRPVMRQSSDVEAFVRAMHDGMRTGVATRTDDGWRCVQGHLSMPANVNETLFD